MSIDSPTPHKPGPTVTPIRSSDHSPLRRVLLWCTLVSVVIGTITGVGMIMAAQPSAALVKVAVTFIVIAMHGGVALSLFTAMDRGLHPKVANIGLVLFALNFVVCLLAVWALEPEWGWRTIGSTVTLLLHFSLASSLGRVVGMKPYTNFAIAALVVVGLSWLSWTIPTWMPTKALADAPWLWRASGTLGVASIALAQIGWLLVTVTAPGAAMYRIAAVGIAAATGIMFITMILAPGLFGRDEYIWRTVAAVVVIDIGATIIAAVMHRLQISSIAKAQSSDAPVISLTCPRCNGAHRQQPGVSACAACGLDIEVNLPNMHCKGCGYFLLNVPARRCPECGKGF